MSRAAFYAENRPAKRPFFEAFAPDHGIVSPLPFERRNTFPLNNAEDGRYTESGPPVPIQNPGGAPPVSYPSSLPYAHSLSTGFGPASDLAGYNISPHFIPFSGHMSPITSQSYNPALGTSHPAPVAHSPTGNNTISSSACSPTTTIPATSHHSGFISGSYNITNSNPTSDSSSLSSQVQVSVSLPLQGQGPTSSSTTSTGSHSPLSNNQGGSENQLSANPNMTRHDMSQEPFAPSMPGAQPAFHNGFHNPQTRTSTTVMHHHEERSGFHMPQQYYDPYIHDTEVTMQEPCIVPEQSSNSAAAAASAQGWEIVERPHEPATSNSEDVPEIDSAVARTERTTRETAKEKRGRGKFSEKNLQETNETRKLKACVRCRMQRIRVRNCKNMSRIFY